MIASTDRMAGWLEVVAAPIWSRAASTIRIHPVCMHHCTCHAISLNGRWVCSSDGSLTIFHSRQSAEHFLELAHIDHYELGEEAELSEDVSLKTQCVSFRPRKGLVSCRMRCSGESALAS
ncbi:hypothetical protein [Denitromonas ohlonensis]|uniref:Uncharacterized protein n=2 Tax=Denitromonas TaxID=139331 RepID=A0A558EI28_9RHOO|nr:hypothetical protein [Denitromonas ohlonensis]TVT48465.1 MAG: hypothetical protein FHP94_10035 [Denitromonas halophila]TVO69461.1 hypothetical protein FHP90_02475 [Denitromonas ohlonensis]TVO77561.1 hypothetical protein FHP89_09705 [Denitromonas ohlonensis]TVT73045.1 MAG: hypothetical protein FHP93_06590 [Denitromonas halophila]TVT74099.1 MAG: hypothetical protein FHP92_14155 [Denitromonas halophila]